MRNTAEVASFVERLMDLELVVGKEDREVAAILTDLKLGAQAVDRIKCRAVMLLESDSVGTNWHDRKDNELLRLAEFRYRGRG